MKIKLLTTAAAIAMISMSASLAMAKNGTQGSGPSPYVDCGIGGAIFKNTGWAAATSNVIWDAGTTAVTSATASPETCNAKKVETAQFILDTYDSLVEDSAKGEGEHLTTMMNIVGCSAEMRKSIVQNVRSGISKNVASSDYDSQSKIEKASALYNVVDSSTRSCSA
tara:strand:+ start:735 stop:1235 length:501 start_codon:yes stop_codon:yes gene_type:complete